MAQPLYLNFGGGPGEFFRQPAVSTTTPMDSPLAAWQRLHPEEIIRQPEFGSMSPRQARTASRRTLDAFNANKAEREAFIKQWEIEHPAWSRTDFLASLAPKPARPEGTMNAPPPPGVERPIYDPRIDQRIIAGGPNDPNIGVMGAFQGGGVGPLTRVTASPNVQTYTPIVKPPPVPNVFGSTQQNELPYWMRSKGGMV